MNCFLLNRFLSILLTVFLSLLVLLVFSGCGSTGSDNELGGQANIASGTPNGVGSEDTSVDTDFDSTTDDSIASGVDTTTDISATGASPLVIRQFLWKPISERDGNLVILVDPVAVRVVVTGARSEEGGDTGPSNDRGTTSRFQAPGSSFGSSVLVEFFDSQGRRVFIADGRESVRVPNGADRLEFRL